MRCWGEKGEGRSKEGMKVYYRATGQSDKAGLRVMIEQYTVRRWVSKC